MTRILHVYKDVYPPVAGGIERHIHSIRLALPDLQHDVLVCSRSHRTDLRSPGPNVSGYEVLVGEFGRVWSTPIAPTFPRWLRRLARDAIVHLHIPNPLGELSSLMVDERTPIVVTYHCDIFRQRAMMPLYKPLLLRVMRQAREVVCASDRLRTNSPVLAALDRDVRVVPFGIDPTQWDPRHVPAHLVSGLRARYGGPFVIAVGRLVSYKGFAQLIDIAAGFPLPLVIVGDGPERSALARQITDRRLDGRVFLAGRVSDDELAAHLVAAQMFVLASVNRAEAFGIATLEAQAAGLPVIVTDVGTGTREAFAPEETGLLVPAGDSRALLGALRQLAGDPVLCARMGEAGRRRIASTNSLEQLGQQLARVYTNAIATPSEY